MKQREQFTWVGPVSDSSQAGAVARDFVTALARIGSLAHVLDTGDGSIAVDFDVEGEVRTRGTTVVRQAVLSQLALTRSIAPLVPGACEVAYVIVDGARPPNAALELLASCDEVWAPSTLQAELLCSLGVERARVKVIAPGTDAGQGAEQRALFPAARGFERALVIGDARLAAELERARSDGPHFEAALAPLGTAAFTRELERADVLVIVRDVDPWGRLVLDALRLAKPLFHVESGSALEYANTEDCIWFDEATARDVARLAGIVRASCADRRQLVERAARARTHVETSDSLQAAARAVVQRATRSRSLPAPRLERLLTELGLPTATERLAGSRAHVLVVPVAEVAGAWPALLRTQLMAHASLADTTICLWVDDALAQHTDAISAVVEREMAQCAAAAVDVLVVVAPLAHAPRERFVTSAA